MDEFLIGAIVAMIDSILFELVFESCHIGFFIGVFLGFITTQHEEIVSFIKRVLKK